MPLRNPLELFDRNFWCKILGFCTAQKLAGGQHKAKLEYRRRHLVVDCLNTKLPKSLNVVLHGLSRRLPVYRGERTFAGWAGMSQRCQYRKSQFLFNHARKRASTRTKSVGDQRRGSRQMIVLETVLDPCA